MSSNSAEQRLAMMRERLEQALAPQELELADEGHKHVGHPGARDGRGHFRLRIVSQAFAGKSPIARHRLVYQALGDLMQTDIHALAVEALTKEET